MTDDRGVTAPIEYILTFTIAAILMIGLVIAATGQVEDQRSRTITAQMDVVGQQVAGSLERVGTKIQDGATSVRVSTELPEELLDRGYEITVRNDVVVIEAASADRNIVVSYETATPVSGTPVQLDGGTAVVEWDNTDLVIENAG